MLFPLVSFLILSSCTAVEALLDAGHQLFRVGRSSRSCSAPKRYGRGVNGVSVFSVRLLNSFIAAALIGVSGRVTRAVKLPAESDGERERRVRLSWNAKKLSLARFCLSKSEPVAWLVD
jgi:hypothetical protein